MASNLKARTLGLLPLGAMPGVSQIPLSTIAALAIKAFRRATLDEAALLSNMHRCSADAGSGRLRPRSRSAFGLTKIPRAMSRGFCFAAGVAQKCGAGNAEMSGTSKVICDKTIVTIGTCPKTNLISSHES